MTLTEVTMTLMEVLGWVLWNVSLAVLPVVLAVFIARRVPQARSVSEKAVIWILGLVWLAFLPNTCYLVTEWRHFLHILDVNDLYVRSYVERDLFIQLMTHTAFFFGYSATGLITFTLALRPIVHLAKRYRKNLTVYALVLFPMLSIGVYLGLVLRYNSWDLISRPHEILASIAAIFSRPKLLSVVVVFAGFLYVAYVAIDIWIDGLIARFGSTFKRLQ